MEKEKTIIREETLQIMGGGIVRMGQQGELRVGRHSFRGPYVASFKPSPDRPDHTSVSVERRVAGLGRLPGIRKWFWMCKMPINLPPHRTRTITRD